MGKALKYNTVSCISCEVPYEQPATLRRQLCPDCFMRVHYCNGCETLKPLEDFAANVNAKNGRQGRCRDCKAVNPTCTCRNCGGSYVRLLNKGPKLLCPDCSQSLAWCIGCCEHKSHDNFGKSPDKHTGLDNRCRACHRERGLQRRYGMPPQEYERLFALQAGVCAICLCPPPDHRPILFVDHNHKTGKVRGLLCNGCNLAIGYLKDSVPIILNAADYVLERSDSYVESEPSPNRGKE